MFSNWKSGNVLEKFSPVCVITLLLLACPLYHLYHHLFVNSFINLPSIYSSICIFIGRAQCSVVILNWSTKCFPSSMINLPGTLPIFPLAFGYSLFLYSSFISVLLTYFVLCNCLIKVTWWLESVLLNHFERFILSCNLVLTHN